MMLWTKVDFNVAVCCENKCKSSQKLQKHPYRNPEDSHAVDNIGAFFRLICVSEIFCSLQQIFFIDYYYRRVLISVSHIYVVFVRFYQTYHFASNAKMIANSQLAQSCDDHFKCNCFHLIESQINQDRIIDGTNETTTSTQASTAIVNHVNSLPAMQLFTIPRLSPLFGLSFKLLFLFLLFYSAVPSGK